MNRISHLNRRTLTQTGRLCEDRNLKKNKSEKQPLAFILSVVCHKFDFKPGHWWVSARSPGRFHIDPGEDIYGCDEITSRESSLNRFHVFIGTIQNLLRTLPNLGSIKSQLTVPLGTLPFHTGNSFRLRNQINEAKCTGTHP